MEPSPYNCSPYNCPPYNGHPYNYPPYNNSLWSYFLIDSIPGITFSKNHIFYNALLSIDILNRCACIYKAMICYKAPKCIYKAMACYKVNCNHKL